MMIIKSDAQANSRRQMSSPSVDVGLQIVAVGDDSLALVSDSPTELQNCDDKRHSNIPVY